MKKLIFFLTLPLVTLVSFSQNYEPINSGHDGLFLKSDYENNVNDQVSSLTIDSVKTNGSNTTYYFRYEPLKTKISYNFNAYGPLWMGNLLELRDSGFVVQNKYNEEIFIKHKAKLGENWIAFNASKYNVAENVISSSTSYARNPNLIVFATVVSVQNEDVLGITDSVKTIQFTCKENNVEVDIPLNGMQIKLSKTYGLVSTLNFLLFPDLNKFEDYYGNVLQELTLVGGSIFENGIKNISAYDIYDFNVGDVFHIEEEFIEIDNWTIPATVTQTYKKYIKRYLEKDVQSTSITYSVEVQTYSIRVKNNTDTLYNNYSIDTVNEVVEENNSISLMPCQLYISGQQAFNHYSMIIEDSAVVKAIKFDGKSYLYDPTNNNFDVITMSDIPTQPYKKYYPGLGGPFYGLFSGSGMTGSYTSRRELVYFNKNEITLTSLPYIDNSESLLYPNPANKYITINAKGIVSVKISSILGIQVFQKQIDAYETIDVRSFAEGMYVISVEDNGITKSQSFIISR